MNIAICTLFEGDYHHGVCALVNSLVQQGFDGQVFAGYRGSLPAWAESAVVTPLGEWRMARTLPVTADCRLVFLPLTTPAHFTNFKPDLMLSLLKEADLQIDSLLYLDPDICLTKDWRFISEWLSCGVALCEDVNSPVSEMHPRRVGWRRHFALQGVELRYRGAEYVNGGCVGVARQNLQFLENWWSLSQYMAAVIGGLGTAKVGSGSAFLEKGFGNCFDCSDQDALNATIEMTGTVAVSILPRTAMAFTPGDYLLPHALGRNKPWRKSYLQDAIRGLPPTPADKAFWACVSGPLRSMGGLQLRWGHATLLMASAISRLYRRV